MTNILYKNFAAVVAGGEAPDVHTNADILVSEGAIVKIGSNLSDTLNADTKIHDCSGLTAYPGLVNTHHHFFQAFIRNQKNLDWTSLDVIEWLDLIYPLFALIDEDCIYQSAIVSMADLIKHGCTTAFDHQYNYSRHAGKLLVDRQFEAAELLGMRFHAGRGCNTLPKSEGSTIPDEMLETTEEFLADCERLADRYHQPEPLAMRRVVVAPCQPVNSYQETFVEAAGLAREKGLFLHTHLGEGENSLMQQRHGLRSYDWCEKIGFVGPDVWFAHCWQQKPEEIRRMAKTNTGVSHCPAPVFLVGAEVTDISAMHAAGLRLGLGVDGQASNDNSNLLESIRLAYMLQCLTANQRQHKVPDPWEFFRMASEGGADCLGRSDLGRLAKGMAADFFAIDLNRLEYVGADHDILSLPAKVGFSGVVDMTVIAGKIVWKNGELIGLDEAGLRADAQRVFESRIYNSKGMRALRH